MITIHRLGIPFFTNQFLEGHQRESGEGSTELVQSLDLGSLGGNPPIFFEDGLLLITIMFVFEMWTTACCFDAWYRMYMATMLCKYRSQQNMFFSQDSMFNTITMWDPKMKRSDQWPWTINQSTGHFECLPLFELFNAFSIQYPHCCHTGHRSHHVGSINFSFASTSPNFSLRSCG